MAPFPPERGNPKSQLALRLLSPGGQQSRSFFSINEALGDVFPEVKSIGIHMGISTVLIPIIVAACWQLTGFAMSMYIAGLATVPNDLREAARIDGATELQVYTKVVMPLLRLVTVSTAIILGHVISDNLCLEQSGTGLF